MTSRVLYFIRVIVFPGIIACPGFFVTHSATVQGLTENRKLAAYPTLSTLSSVRNWSAYFKAFEAWFNDHVGFRDIIIRDLAEVRWNLFKTCQSKLVLSGRNGWLYYWSENDPSRTDWEGNTIADFMGEYPYSEDELNRIDSSLRRAAAIFDRLGIVFVVIVGPNQTTIYPEYLPWWVRLNRGESRLAQLYRKLQQTRNPVIFPDLRPRLLEQKPNGLAYFKTDTHWTLWGGFAAYEELMIRLREKRPKLVGLERKDVNFVFEYSPQSNSGTASLAALEGKLPDIKVRADFLLTPPTKAKDRVAVFCDSFYGGIQAFVNETFETVSFKHHNWGPPDFEAILIEKTDIVVYVVTERLAMRALPRFETAVDSWERQLAQMPAAR
jgi:hypothetical protein